VAEEREHPEGVCGPPVVLVAVDDDRRVSRDALRAEQCGELLVVDVVADDGVVEVGVPVDLHRSRDVSGLVEEHVFIGFDHDEAGFTEVFGEPLGGDETLWVGVLGELRCGVELGGHGTSWDRPIGRAVRGAD
jgi:hypothetical protein